MLRKSARTQATVSFPSTLPHAGEKRQRRPHVTVAQNGAIPDDPDITRPPLPDSVTTPKKGRKRKVESSTAQEGSPVRVKEEEETSKPKQARTPRKRKIEAFPESESPERTLIPLVGAPTLIGGDLSFHLPTAISHLSSADPRFSKVYEHLPIKPYTPPIEAIDPFKTLVTSIIGQQVSWMAAKAINGRFKALFGYDGDQGFPTPGEIVKKDALTLKGVGLSLRKAEYVLSLAEHFVSGQISSELLRDGTDEEIAKALIAVRGIGQWTVDMFLMFSLRRPDILPVGDLGVQKGLLRWALSAHDALPKKERKEGKKALACKAKYAKPKEEVKIKEDEELDTTIRTPEPETLIQNGAPPTPITPGNDVLHEAVLHTPGTSKLENTPLTPSTPSTRSTIPGLPAKEEPREVLELSANDLPAPTQDELMQPVIGHPAWSKDTAAPLEGGLSIELLKSRLSGKKAKGGVYLTPQEMEVLTDAWKPYRSIGVYYMWPAGEEY